MMTKITLLLAQGPGQPDGDITDRLTLSLALNSQGQIDAQAYESAPQPWLARREGATSRELEVIRVDDGWALQSTDSLDDPIWTFEGHVYRPGELVQLRRPDGERMLFRIVATEAE